LKSLSVVDALLYVLGRQYADLRALRAWNGLDIFDKGQEFAKGIPVGGLRARRDDHGVCRQDGICDEPVRGSDCVDQDVVVKAGTKCPKNAGMKCPLFAGRNVRFTD